MKIDRLYAITVYLLSHGRTSANTLAQYFEVSLRTIQRDMDSLCLSGIPVISIAGAKGDMKYLHNLILNATLQAPTTILTF